jgi:hypothetical protein
MSQESPTPDPLELQKRLTDAANRRDLDAMMAWRSSSKRRSWTQPRS